MTGVWYYYVSWLFVIEDVLFRILALWLNTVDSHQYHVIQINLSLDNRQQIVRDSRSVSVWFVLQIVSNSHKKIFSVVVLVKLFFLYQLREFCGSTK